MNLPVPEPTAPPVTRLDPPRSAMTLTALDPQRSVTTITALDPAPADESSRTSAALDPQRSPTTRGACEAARAGAMTPAALLALFTDPADAGRRAIAARAAAFGPHIAIRPAPAHPAPAVAAVLRDGAVLDLSPAPGPNVHVPADMSLAPGPNAHVPAYMSLTPGPGDPVIPDMPHGPGPDHPEDPAPSPAPGPANPGWPEPATLRPGDRLVLAVDHPQLPAYCAWLVRAASSAPGWSLAPFCPRPGGLFRLHLIAAARLALPAGVRVEVRHDLHGVRLAQVALQFGADTLAGPIDAGRHLPLAGVPRPSETSAAALSELVRQAGFEPTTPESAP